MASNEVRFRRPKEKELLIQSLKDEAGFFTMRDVLLFAAALGYANGRRSPFEGSGEPIRYETMVDPVWAKPFVEMLAVATFENEPEILSTQRVQEQVTVFEEYANGGLEYLQGEVNRRREPLDVVCASLVIDALADAEVRAAVSLQDLAGELTW